MQEGTNFLYCNICLSLTGDSEEHKAVGYHIKFHKILGKEYKEMFQDCPMCCIDDSVNRSNGALRYYKTKRGKRHIETTRNRYLYNNPMSNPEFRKNFDTAILKPERIEAIRESVLEQYRTGKKVPPKEFTHKYVKTGYFYSKKNKKNMFYRSSYEKRAYEVLEEDNNVIKYQGNMGLVIPLTNKHSYFPDILIEYKDGSKKLVEVKPYNFLKHVGGDHEKHEVDGCSSLVRKIEVAEEFCEKRGWDFEIWTDKCLK